jgi:hypothetical protein
MGTTLSEDELASRFQSERGKRNSRFNAVTIGLFAEHVAILVCDGEEAEKDFLSLLNEAHEEFRSLKARVEAQIHQVPPP